MPASTTTTIRGVSIFSRQQKRKADVFDIALSPGGIVIQRPGRGDQHMTWDRISQWEIDEGPGCVVLTLRGGGSVTPLMVKGWRLEDLESVMRVATEGTTGAAAALPGAATLQAPPPESPSVEPSPVEPPPVPATTTAQPRAAHRQVSRRPWRSEWRTFVTIVLLSAVAAAVTVVLLQSAGVISWSFLGPVA